MKPDRSAVLKFEDRTSFLYLEQRAIRKQDDAVVAENEEGTLPIPAAALGVLMLGPGTSITQQAVMALSQCGCPIAWVGEEGVRLYGFGQPLSGDTRLAERQALLCAHEVTRADAARQLYGRRFGVEAKGISIEQMRGMEGGITAARYSELASAAGAEWSGRETDLPWDELDEANRALSAAHACLYAVSAAAVLSQGLNPALGLIHRGDPWSLAFDMADLYKLSLAAPTAFAEAAKGGGQLESRTREAMRDAFRKERLMEKLIADLKAMFGGGK